MKLFRQRTSRRVFLNRSLFGVAALSGLPFAGLPFGRVANGREQDKRYQISLHQYSLKQLFESGRLDLLAYARFAKDRLQISNIEFAAEFCTDLLASPSKADAIREQSQQAGVTNRVMLCGDETALDAPDAKQRAVAIDEHVEWAKVAERLGCQYIRVRASTEGDRQQQLVNASAGIGGLCDALESSSVSVLVENIAGWSRRPDWLVELVKQVGEKRVGLVADFGNFDGDIYEGMKTIVPYAKSICTKSWEFDASGNETKIDFQRMMSVINDSTYRGCIAIEYLGTDPVSGILKTAALINRFGAA
jgi:sugar phosphate isomerase/epimerase